MEQLVRKFRTSTFIRHNTVFFIGSLFMGFLNYLYYPVLGRLLAPAPFGEVQVLASLLAQISIFLSVIGMITVNIVANYEANERRNRVIIELERLALVVALGLVVVTTLGGPILQAFFNFASSAPFAILAIAVAVTVPLTFRGAYLRGKQRFGIVAWVGIIASAADLVLAAAFVLLGWSTTGVMIALVLGQAIAFGVSAFFARRHGFNESLRGVVLRLPDVRLIAPELKYAGVVLVCSLAITVMYSMDTLVVKHYFNAHIAGLYAGISTIARIIFFLMAPVIQVMLPTIKIRLEGAANRRVLFKSLALMVAVGGATLAVFTVVPRLVISILMGHTYLPFAYLLPRLGLVMFIISLLNLLIVYNLALRRYSIITAIIPGFLATLGFVRLQHGSLAAVVNSLLYGSLALFALLGGWLAATRLNKSHA
jgi:O-antigen/teichoic acid export membrane protein